MPSLELSEIHWPAVIAAALVAFFIAGAWYQALFRQAWVDAQGWSPEKVAELQARMNPARFFGGMIVSYLLLAFALAALASAADVENLTQGLCLAGLAWVITACVTFTHQLASGRHVNAWLVDTGCELVYLLAMGAIIGTWR